jgi:DNA-3-methyladenine glycosylase II
VTPTRLDALASDEAIAALSGADPVLGGLIASLAEVDLLGERRRARPSDHYGVLIRAIIGQQVSTASAAAIFTRLTDRYGGRLPTAAEILDEDVEEWRPAVGLSRAKAAYLRSLAEQIISGQLELEALDQLPDDQVIAELTAVKGIGLWSAQVFLIFHLGRPDVLITGDLGVRRAVMFAYGLPAMPSETELAEIGACWAPHRTLACLYLWRSLDGVAPGAI